MIKVLGAFTFFFFSLRIGGGWEQGAEGGGESKQGEYKGNWYFLRNGSGKMNQVFENMSTIYC